jgi:hypothetical protein
VLELRAAVANRADLLELLGVLHDDRDRVRVLEDVLAFLWRVGLVDRHDGRAGGERSEVHPRPLDPGVGEDRDAVPALDAEVDEAERVAADHGAKLRVGLVDPLPGPVLELDRGARSVGGDRPGQEVGDRCRAHALLVGLGRGFDRRGLHPCHSSHLGATARAVAFDGEG